MKLGRIGSLLTGGVAVLALAFSAFAQSAGASASKIVIQEVEHNIGQVPKGETAKHVFVFRNAGTADLEIKNVAPS